MVELTTVQSLNHEFSRVAEPFKHLKRLFVDVMRAEVLCHCAVIHVRQAVDLGSGDLGAACPALVKQILNVQHVDIADLVHRIRFLLR